MGAFESIGLTEDEERCYLALVERGEASAAEVAADIGVSLGELRRVVAALEAKGFVTRTPGRPQRLAAARPDLAFEALILRREEELDRVRREAEHLAAEVAGRTRTHEPARPVELITGRDAVAQWWVQVQRSAKREVLIFDRPPYVLAPTQPNPVEADLLPRGISYRVLYDETSLDDPRKIEAARSSAAAGELGRVAAGVPIKLIIADRSMALTHDSAAVDENATIVYQSSLLNALVALFESLWLAAAPLDFGTRGDAELDETDRTILALLSAGAKDERVARQLGVGLRTVRRRVARMMDALDARTRFQAALRAAKRGWIS